MTRDTRRGEEQEPSQGKRPVGAWHPKVLLVDDDPDRLALDRAIGETFHITSDEWLTWDQIHQILARAAGARAQLIHVPSDVIIRYDRRWGESLLADKTHSMVFDNAKIRRFVPDFTCTVPFSRGAEEIVAWHDADPARRVINAEFDATMDRIIADYAKTWS